MIDKLQHFHYLLLILILCCLNQFDILKVLLVEVLLIVMYNKPFPKKLGENLHIFYPRVIPCEKSEKNATDFCEEFLLEKSKKNYLV